MIVLRPAGDRGHANHGWLDSRHTFSFADYYDPDHMGFRALRVINEDHVEPGKGFGSHPHRNMEIISYILEGALEHKDSLGNGSTIQQGEVQRLTAGRGIMHSEYNPSLEHPVHFLQIWIEPAQAGLTPGYEQKPFDLEADHGRLVPIAAPQGAEKILTLHQDVSLYAARLKEGQTLNHPLESGRYAWVQVAAGGIALNGQTLGQGDGAAVSEEEALEISAGQDAEFLLFDLA